MQHNVETKKEPAPAEEEEETFRWFDVVRYAVAVVVGLLAVGVLAGAILVVLRPDALDVKVIHGSIQVDLPPGVQHRRSPQSLKFTFHLEASNPSGRATISFTGISATISTAADDETMPSRFPLNDVNYVTPEQVANIISVQTTTNPRADAGDYFVNKLTDGETIAVTMLIQGILTTTVGGEGIHSSRDNVTYTCLGIILTVDKSLSSTCDDVSCSRKSHYFGKHF